MPATKFHEPGQVYSEHVELFRHALQHNLWSCWLSLRVVNVIETRLAERLPVRFHVPGSFLVRIF